jgi:putative ABC transport system permease protein
MVPVSYNCRNLRVRWKTTLMTAAAFTLVVAALVVMLAFIKGIERACAVSGEPENVLLLAKGNNDEVMSQLGLRVAAQVEHEPGVAVDPAGQPLASRELYMVVDHRDDNLGAYHLLQVRGVQSSAYLVHTTVSVREGQLFRPGQSELMIGKGVQREQGLQVGDQIELGRKRWKITGVFDANGAAFESEVWGDLNELSSQFRREGVYSSITVRAASPEAAQSLADRIGQRHSVNVEAMTEPKYYQKQAEQTTVLRTAAWVIAWFMGVGAMFGIMNTMVAAIAQRTKDIAVLRIMGFEAGDILLSFLLEAVLIALVGGGLGLALGCTTNGVTRSTSLGARQIDISFHVDTAIVLFTGVFTLVMGILGGGIPALSAMRIKPLESLR